MVCSKVEFKVIVDTKSNLNAAEVNMQITDLKAVGQINAIPTAIIGTSTKSNIVYFGTNRAKITMTSAGSLTIGSSSNIIGNFKIENKGDEDLGLDYLTLVSTNNAFANSAGYSNLKIMRRQTIDSEISISRIGNAIAKPTSKSNRIRLDGYTIKQGEEIDFEIWVDADENTALANFEIYIDSLETKGKDSKIVANISGEPTATVQIISNK